MVATQVDGEARTRPLGVLTSGRTLRALLPALSLALVLIAIAWLNPRAISYFGFNLMLNLAIPIALATIARCLRLPATSSTCRSAPLSVSSAV